MVFVNYFKDEDFGMAGMRRQTSRQDGSNSKRQRGNTSAMSTFLSFPMMHDFGGFDSGG